MDLNKSIHRELELYKLGYPLSSDIIEMMEFIDNEIGKCIINESVDLLRYKHRFYHLIYFTYYKNSGNFFLGSIFDNFCEKYNFKMTDHTHGIISTLIKHTLKLE